jgi:hypothetical protein
MSGAQKRIGRHAVALGKDDQVAPDHLGAGNALFGALADNERARASQIAQAVEHPFGSGLLYHCD